VSVISIVIPAKNEAASIGATIDGIRQAFRQHHREYEIIVVNDGSTDGTGKVVKYIADKDPNVRIVRNEAPYGFGYAIRKGLEHFRGEMVIIAMADASDDPQDMLHYVEQVEAGADCCFGTRWNKDAKVTDYPFIKYVLNRTVNGFINVLFNLGYNDVTNAFKCYSRATIDGIKPIMSRHFNITVELPLKAIVRGYTYKVIPTHWYQRKKGISKLKIQEMGSRYLFVIINVFLERLLCGGDYKKADKINP
jgi:dolichol-phosphate mannosyltransferase